MLEVARYTGWPLSIVHEVVSILRRASTCVGIPGDLAFTWYPPCPYIVSRDSLSFLGSLYFCLRTTSCQSARLVGVSRPDGVLEVGILLGEQKLGCKLCKAKKKKPCVTGTRYSVVYTVTRRLHVGCE